MWIHKTLTKKSKTIFYRKQLNIFVFDDDVVVIRIRDFMLNNSYISKEINKC